MKVFRYIVWSVLLAVGLIYVLPATIVQLPYFQKKISHTIASYLRERIDTEITIEQIEIQPFHKLILKNVYMEDQQGEILFTAKRIACDYNFLSLLQKKIYLKTAQLYTFQLHLSKENPDAPLNIQYIIDAFQSKDSENKETAIDWNIQTLSLGNGTFSYHVKNKPFEESKFNANDLYFNQIAAKIHLNKFDKDTLDLSVQRLSFQEQSGFAVKQLQGDILINEEAYRMNELLIELPHSHIRLTDITGNFLKLSSKPVEHTTIKLQVRPTLLALQDIGPLLPVLRTAKDILEINGSIEGNLEDLTFRDFTIKETDDLLFRIDATARNLMKSDSPDKYIHATITNSYLHTQALYDRADYFHSQNIQLPNYLKNLGKVSINGNLSGNPNNLFGDIYLVSGIGDLKANINFGTNTSAFIKGNLSTTSLNLKELFNNDDWGDTVFNIDLDLSIPTENSPSGRIDALINELNYKAHTYENINLSGQLTEDSFNGTINVDSPEGKLTAEGLAVWKDEYPDFNFSAQASGWQLDKLNLTNKYTDPELTFSITANMKGNNEENLSGDILINDLLFKTNKGEYSLDRIHLTTTNDTHQKNVSIDSPLLSGSLTGNFTFSSLSKDIQRSLAFYLPSAFGELPKDSVPSNRFSFDLSVADTRNFSSIFELPLTIYSQANLKGSYDNTSDSLRLEAKIPYLQYHNYRIENNIINLANDHHRLNLKIAATHLGKNNKLLLNSEWNIGNDSIYSSVRWTDQDKGKYKGALNFNTYIAAASKGQPLFASIHFQPSEMVFNDSLWRISPTILEMKEKQFYINHLEAFHHNQKVKINGFISENPDDELLIELENVNLDAIFQILNKKALTFGGIANGHVSSKDLFKTRQLATHLTVRNFSFNHSAMGDLSLDGKWIEEKGGIEMKGLVLNNDSSYVNIDGFIYPVKEDLSIWFNAQNTPAAFLRKYVNNIVQDLSGNLTGKIRLFGDLNHPTVEGNVYVKDGRFGVNFLNTQYTFSDWVRCTPNEIRINNTVFRDKYGNRALANGYVTHQQFSDFRFSTRLSYENFLIFDATRQTNSTFYGPVFGSGTANIEGTEYLVNIDVSMQNTENTHLTLNFMDETDIVDYRFINFVRKVTQDTIETPAPWQWYKPTASSSDEEIETDIRLNLHVNANNEALVDMIMDPVSDDKISARGNGSMQIQYGTKIPLKVIGGYTIESGKYNFSFQQALFRNFDIEEGSSIIFSGDPYTADLNIKAAYTASANLGDLDQQLLQISSRSNVQVDCILLLNGPLQHPQIKFDLALPNSTAEIERQVKGYIRTEDMLNRQIVYLLVLGRFYTSPEYAGEDARFNNDLSYLTSTLSNQLSNILGGINDKIRVGTKFHQTYEGEDTNTEIEILLSSTLLNNRLIINGNFGYIDNMYTQGQNNNAPLVGDFDVEYKLTKNGDIRLRGFNRYNYRNYFSTAPEMTQGIGIMFRRDFNNLKDLLQRKKAFLIPDLPE